MQDIFSHNTSKEPMQQNITASTSQLRSLLKLYQKAFPLWTFPLIPLFVAAVFQSMAWLSGPIFLSNLTLMPRIMVLWLFALGEYMFMSPSMNAAVEVLGMSEALLVVIYQVMTLVVFIFMNIFVFRKPMHYKYIISFVFLTFAVYIAYM
jgi:uncharacterized protein